MKYEHLEMIQKIINKMSKNSFLLKGWAVLVIVAIFTFTGESNNDIRCILFTNIPLIVFWGLDSYYLQLERKYRKLYDDIRQQKNEKTNFNMNPNNIKISISTSKEVSFMNCFLSATEILFYGTCIVTTVLIYIFA